MLLPDQIHFKTINKKSSGTPSLWIVGICAAIFVSSSSFFDIARPAWTPQQHYSLAAFDFLLVLVACAALYWHRRVSGVAAPPPDERIAIKGPDPLLTLRGFACLFVLMGHYFAVVFPVGNLIETLHKARYYALLSSCPWAGVWIFYTLSGYLMGKGFFTGRYSLTRESVGNFYINRVLRIYPVYISALALVSILQMPFLFSPANAWTLIQASIFNAAGAQTTISIGALNTLSTEFQFYMLAPFFALTIIWLAKSRAASALLMAILLLLGGFSRYVALRLFHWVWATDIYLPFACNADLFLIGMLCAKFIANKEHFSSPLLVKLGLASIPAFYVFASLEARHLYWGWQLNGFVSVMPGCCALFVVLFALAFEKNTAFGKSSLANKIVGRTQLFGILTYCIYVWHSPLMLSFRRNFGASLSARDTYAMIVPVFAAIAIFSYAAYRFIERPFEKRKLKAAQFDRTAHAELV